MIKVLTDQQIDGTVKASWSEFITWLRGCTEFQFDIETDVTEWWCTKKLMTMQFGNISGHLQYFIEYAWLNEEQKAEIKEVLESWKVLKLIHRASFEYVVMRFHGMEIHNVYCTLVAEKVIQGGIENEDYALTALTEKYLGIPLDKTLQTSFGDPVLTLAKVEYACDDVKYLGPIRDRQMTRIKEEELNNVIWLEMRSLLAFSDCTYYGVTLDVDKWRENIALAQPLVNESKGKLDLHVMGNSKMLAKAIELGYYATEDKLLLNFNSHQQVGQVLRLLYPDINGSAQGSLKGYLKDRPWLGSDDWIILTSILVKDYTPLVDYLLKYFKEYLISHGLLVPRGTLIVNWNSVDQVLPLAKCLEPKLKNLSADALANCTHEFFDDLADYKDNLKLLSSYGEAFILKHVEPDGKVRTNYNQVVSTGRSSSANPNMQNIPAKESVGNRYRNCFLPTPGFDMVDSDFKGQELALIAHVAQDEVWFTAITNNEDLHSVTAEMVFKNKWKQATSPGCTYYNPCWVQGENALLEDGYNLIGRPEGWRLTQGKQKCKCKGHKSLRSGVKTINFGLAYGMSKFKLSATMRIPLKEAQALIDLYFATFPKIKTVLNALGRFGVENGFIKTLFPFGRKRWFPYWRLQKVHIKEHLGGQYNSDLGAIERASKNMPFQGSGEI